jgi:hypothetical protein
MRRFVEMINYLRDDYAYFKFACTQDEAMPRFLFAAWMVGWLKMLARIAACATMGHKLVDDSYGGPESGYEGCYCERCGKSFGTVLY